MASSHSRALYIPSGPCLRCEESTEHASIGDFFLCPILCCPKKGVQFFLARTIRGTVYPKNILHGGTFYSRIFGAGVHKTGEAKYPATPGSKQISHIL